MARGKKTKSRTISRQGGAPRKAPAPEPPFRLVAEEDLVAEQELVDEEVADGADEPAAPAADGPHGQAADLRRRRCATCPIRRTPRRPPRRRTRRAKPRSPSCGACSPLSLDQRGPDDPGTLRARADIAMSLWHMGRHDEAIEIEEALVKDSERVLGVEHPEALTARANLASSLLDRRAHRRGDRDRGGRPRRRRAAARPRSSRDADRARQPRLLVLDGRPQGGRRRRSSARSSPIASACSTPTIPRRSTRARTSPRRCWNADLVDEAIAAEEQILAETERINGTDAVDTLQARAALASSYRMAGRAEDAAALQDRVVLESERVLGVDHPATVAARKTRELN